MSKKKSKAKSKTKKRYDGRKPEEIRPIKIESGVLPNADGSAYIEMGRNKIVVGVFGPREMHPKRFAKPNAATLRCRYHMAPFSVNPRRSPAPSRRDNEISMVIRHAPRTSYIPRKISKISHRRIPRDTRGRRRDTDCLH